MITVTVTPVSTDFIENKIELASYVLHTNVLYILRNGMEYFTTSDNLICM